MLIFLRYGVEIIVESRIVPLLDVGTYEVLSRLVSECLLFVAFSSHMHPTSEFNGGISTICM